MPRVRPGALRPASPHVHTAPRTWAKGKRRIHRPGLPDSITANCIAPETKPHGGKSSTLIRYQWHSGYGSTRGRTIEPALMRQLSPRPSRKATLLTELRKRRPRDGGHVRGADGL